MRDTHYRGKGAFVVEKKKRRMRDTHYRGEGAFVIKKKTPDERYTLQGRGRICG